jgi:hypothetical protein
LEKKNVSFIGLSLEKTHLKKFTKIPSELSATIEGIQVSKKMELQKKETI